MIELLCERLTGKIRLRDTPTESLSPGDTLRGKRSHAVGVGVSEAVATQGASASVSEASRSRSVFEGEEKALRERTYR